MSDNHPSSAPDSGARREARPGRPHRRRRQRKRRLTDKIRAALARAAALGRRDMTQQLKTLYEARVQEELDQGRQRRTRDGAVPGARSARGR